MDSFFHISYAFNTAKIAGGHRKKVQLVDDFKMIHVRHRI